MTTANSTQTAIQQTVKRSDQGPVLPTGGISLEVQHDHYRIVLHGELADLLADSINGISGKDGRSDKQNTGTVSWNLPLDHCLSHIIEDIKHIYQGLSNSVNPKERLKSEKIVYMRDRIDRLERVLKRVTEHIVPDDNVVRH